MKIGIIGAPQSGKTTVFNAASGQKEAVGDFSQASHRAVVKVPDERVDRLSELFNPKKITYAEIEFLDAPGFTGTGSKADAAEINPELKMMDTLLVVIDGFGPTARPRQAISNLIDEMILNDQVVIENNLEKKGRKAKLTGDKSDQREMDLLKACHDSVENGKPLIDLVFGDEELKLLRGYAFFSQKPLLIVLNISEDDLGRSAEITADFADLLQPGKRDVAVMCGKIEMELVDLEGEDRTLFMQELGIDKPAVDLVIQKSYALLGLISFLTAGEKEVRAWPIKAGTNAHRAAGVIHSDIERGFIRAEVTRYEDLLQFKTPAALRAAGKIRLEGKEYVVQDGDEILFRFNV